MNDQQQQPLLAAKSTNDNIASRQPLPLEWTRVQRTRTTTSLKKNDTGSNKNDTEDTMNDIKRKRSRSTVMNEKEDTENECNDVNCRRCAPQELISITDSGDPTVSKSMNGNNAQHYHFSGKVIFCLPDQDCDWFQGYYFPFDNNDDEMDILDNLLPSHHTPSQYYGLLCTVQSDLDECLQCTAGGYREIATIKMTLLNDCKRNMTKDRKFSSPSPTMKTSCSATAEDNDDLVHTVSTTTTAHHPKRINVSNVTWVGGDMMNLYKTESNRNSTTTTTSTTSPTSTTTTIDRNDDIPSNVSVLRMQTATLYTGSSSTSSHVQRYFHNYLRYMMDAHNDQQLCDGTNDEQPLVAPPVTLTNDNYKQVIEQLMPDVAIVVGTMDLWMT